MMRLVVLTGLLMGLTAPLAAQAGPPADRMREQVVQRFLENYRHQAGLTDEQFGQVQQVLRRSFEARRDLQERERGLLRSLEGQMRPGVAANSDSVAALIDRLLQVQADRVDLARREQVRFAEFLTPVQRAQLVLAVTRLENLIEDQARQRREGMRRPR
jgi:Spy/CpxP family protein refolding chaperone